MDIFSAGCVIAEIFLEGEPLFDLSQLLNYRENAYSPVDVVVKIADPDIRELVMHMIQLDPCKRLSASGYLEQWGSHTFSPYFPFLYRTCANLLSPEHANPDRKIAHIGQHQDDIVREVLKGSKMSRDKFATNQSGPSTPESPSVAKSEAVAGGITKNESSSSIPVSGPQEVNEVELEQFARSLEKNTATLMQIGEVPDELVPGRANAAQPDKTTSYPPGDPNQFDRSDSDLSQEGEGLTMVVSIICSCIQNVRYPRAKVMALDLLLEFGRYVGDEVRLCRIVPYATTMLVDDDPVVRATAVHTLTETLLQVTSFAASDAHIFPEYILPALSRIPSDRHEFVQIAYAQSVGSLAQSTRRFLDIKCYKQLSELQSGPERDTGNTVKVEESYDAELGVLRQSFLKLVIDMLTLGSSKVKRCVLADITRLCIFMGRRIVNNDLLLHLITVLNDRDWELRAAFFEHVVGVSVFVGRESFQACILPCMEQALFDPQEFVIQAAVHALTAVCELGLFQERMLLDIVPKVTPLLVHPSKWIRKRAIKLMVAMSQTLGSAKSYCRLLPLLKPFLKEGSGLVCVTRETLHQCLRSPMRRKEFQQAIASKDCFDQIDPPRSKLKVPASKLSRSAREVMDQEDSEANANITTRARSGSGATDYCPYESDADDEHEKDDLVVAEEESILTGDGELAKLVLNYIQRASSAIVQASLPAPEEEQILEDYIKLEESIPLYGIDIPPTAADHAQLLTPIDKVQQDLYESLGVTIPGRGAPFSSQIRSLDPDSKRNLDQNVALTKRTSALPSVSSSGRQKALSSAKAPIIQSPDRVSQYVLKALSIPNTPRDLGALRPDTVSNSSFYRNRHVLENGAVESDPVDWRPRGILVACLTEHKGSVNEISVSRDNVFMVSGSDDGTVKVWDCQRLQNTTTASSQRTYTQGGKITSVTVCDSSHAVAASSTNGTVHVFKVELADSGKQEPNRYAALTDIKKVESSEGAVLRVEHFNTQTESLLTYATQYGFVHGWDLRSRVESWLLTLEFPAMGLLTAMCIGPNPYCLLAGTSRGFIVLWDLRFQTAVQTWRHNAKSKIVKLWCESASTILPGKRELQHRQKGPLVFATAEGTNQIAAFDLYTGEYVAPLETHACVVQQHDIRQKCPSYSHYYVGECRLVFRVMSANSSSSLSTIMKPQKKSSMKPSNRDRLSTIGPQGVIYSGLYERYCTQSQYKCILR